MRLVVTEHRPLRRGLIIVCSVAAVALAIAVALDYGHWKSIAQAMISTGEKRSLLEEVATLRSDNEEFRFEVARLRREAGIDEAARTENHREIVKLQAQIADLSNELAFYRDVLGATEMEQGPRLRGVRFNALDADGQYAYRFILTHVDKNNSVAEGRLKVDIVGQLKGEKRALAFSDVSEDDAVSLAFKFKHFQMFQGTMKMPTDFQPEQITIAVQGRGRRQAESPQTYNWAKVLN